MTVMKNPATERLRFTSCIVDYLYTAFVLANGPHRVSNALSSLESIEFLLENSRRRQLARIYRMFPCGTDSHPDLRTSFFKLHQEQTAETLLGLSTGMTGRVMYRHKSFLPKG